jgi:hypothetical protein
MLGAKHERKHGAVAGSEDAGPDPVSFPSSHPSSFPSSDPPSHDETRTQQPKKLLQISNIREDESTPISMAQKEKSDEK